MREEEKWGGRRELKHPSMGYNGPSPKKPQKTKTPFRGVEAKEQKSENFSTNSTCLSLEKTLFLGLLLAAPSLCTISLLNAFFRCSWYLYDSCLAGFPYSYSFPKPQSQNAWFSIWNNAYLSPAAGPQFILCLKQTVLSPSSSIQASFLMIGCHSQTECLNGKWVGLCAWDHHNKISTIITPIKSRKKCCLKHEL